MAIIRRWLLLACLLLCSAPYASPALSELLIADQPHYSLSRHFAVLQHQGAPLQLEEVLIRSTAGEFEPIKASSVSATNFGLTRAEVWLELDFATAAQLPERWLLELGHASLDQIDLYMAANGGPFSHQHAGDRLPFADKPLPHRHHLFELQLQPETRYRLFLRVRSEGTLSVPVTLWQPDAIWANDQLSYSLLSLYYGLLAGLMIYNFFLFLALRDRLYIIYVAFVGLLALGQGGLAGLTGQFLWPHNALLTHLSPTAGVSLAGVFGALFVQRFLGSTPRSLRLHWLMPLIGLVYGLTFLCTLFGSYFVAAVVVNITSLAFALSSLMLGALACYQRQPGARLFVLAWLSLLVSIPVMALHNLGMLPSNAFTANALLFGSAAEMLLLSLALADRINSIQRAQEVAQQEALAVNRKMVAALQENEQLLESRVAERTQALKEANTQLQLSKQLLERQANHDALTGLANRKLLSDRLEGAVRRAQRSGTGFALMVIDLDRFKSINDSLGHQAGDQVLVEVSKRLTATLRDIDTVARVGGDEFVLILESTATRAAVTVVRQKLMRQVLRPILLASGEQASIGMSVGAALYPEDAQDIELLFSLADKEMYSSKPLQFPS